MKQVQLSHGGGGEETNRLISELFYRAFDNEVLVRAEDAALLRVGPEIAFTTDSFTVSPLFFNGGDIGKIAVAGTVNDLAMMGAKPLYLSSAFILEEGLAFEALERIVASMAQELARSGAKIVCGDTKVVPRGACDRIFINTSGIGEMVCSGVSAHNIRSGDVLIVSGSIGSHGATVLAQREGIEIESSLQSDCATLWSAVEALIESGVKIKAMRDATRGGLAAVLNEWAESSQVCLELEEARIPVADEVRGICEMLGFEPYDFANEGTFVVAVEASEADRALEALRSVEVSAGAARIGRASMHRPGRVVLQSPWGSSRYLELPKGELLPRIC